MAGEITQNQCQVTASKGGASVNSGTWSKALDMAGDHMAKWTQLIGTSIEAIAVPADITANCHLFARNIDSTNFVTIYKEVGGTNQKGKLVAGDWEKIANTPKAELYAGSDTAACICEFVAISV